MKETSVKTYLDGYMRVFGRLLEDAARLEDKGLAGEESQPRVMESCCCENCAYGAGCNGRMNFVCTKYNTPTYATKVCVAWEFEDGQ